MKKVLAFLCAIFTAATTYAQGFSGSIEFKYYTDKDTTENVYIVKDKTVRLDKFIGKTKNIEGSFIFDLKNNKIKFISHQRKIWGDHRSENATVGHGLCEVSRLNGTKTIAGMKCKEFVVKNTTENTTITYWITESKFDFFIPMLKLWNRKGMQNIYFLQIKDLPPGSMPMMSEERHISDGKMVSKLEVIKINTKVPDDASLEVPAGYTKFDQ